MEVRPWRRSGAPTKRSSWSTAGSAVASVASRRTASSGCAVSSVAVAVIAMRLPRGCARKRSGKMSGKRRSGSGGSRGWLGWRRTTALGVALIAVLITTVMCGFAVSTVTAIATAGRLLRTVRRKVGSGGSSR